MKGFDSKDFLKTAILASIITIPLHIKIHGFFIILTFVLWIIYCRKNRLQFKFRPWLLLLFSALSLLSIISLVYTKNTRIGLAHIEAYLSALVWPVILLSNEDVKIESRFLIRCLQMLVITVTLCSLYCHLSVVYEIATNETTWNDFFSFYQYQTTYLSGFANLHPTYFSIYILLSVAFLGSRVNRQVGWLKKALSIILILYQIVFLFQLGSRVAMIGFIAMLLTAMIYLFVKRKERIMVKVTFLLVGGTLFSLFVVLSPIAKYKFYDTLITAWKEKTETSSNNSITLHFRSWRCSVDAVTKAEAILGAGVGDAQDLLSQCYRAKGWDNMAEASLNSHNQYLTIFLKFGLVGVGLFLGLLVYNIRLSLSNNDILFMIFVLFMAICFIGESVLEREKGISFFYLFLCCFANNDLNQSGPRKK